MKLWTLKEQQRTREMFRLTIAMLIVAIPMSFLNYSIFEVGKQVETLTDTLTESTLGFSNKIDSLTRDIDGIDGKVDDLQVEFDDIAERIRSYEVYSSTVTLSDFEAVLADSYDRTVEDQAKLYADDRNYANFYGRFYVPDAKLDVVLYYGLSQAAADRQDSAAIFTWGTYYGKLIADHNNQEFSKLFSVEVGTEGYIQLANGDIIGVVCVDVFNGHNTGDLITDENYVSVHGLADYLTYTCRNGWRNVRICLWNVM